jgi:hypothetical protein
VQNRLGNVTETPLFKLWNGETLHRWRVAQAEGRFAHSGPFCTHCNWRSAGVMTSVRVEDYLRAHGEQDALIRFRRRHDRRHPH